MEQPSPRPWSLNRLLDAKSARQPNLKPVAQTHWKDLKGLLLWNLWMRCQLHRPILQETSLFQLISESTWPSQCPDNLPGTVAIGSSQRYWSQLTLWRLQPWGWYSHQLLEKELKADDWHWPCRRSCSRTSITWSTDRFLNWLQILGPTKSYKVQIHHMHVQIVHTIVTVAPVDLEQQTAFSDHASTSHTPLT